MSKVVGDLIDLGAHLRITAGANVAAKTLVNLDGTIPASAAVCTGGVANVDCPSGSDLDLKLHPGIYAVVATGTVTLGGEVEGLSGSVYGNINGTKTAITATGVQDLASGFKIGRARSAGSAGDIVLIDLYSNQAK